jgi:hypothetical protein
LEHKSGRPIESCHGCGQVVKIWSLGAARMLPIALFSASPPKSLLSAGGRSLLMSIYLRAKAGIE